MKKLYQKIKPIACFGLAGLIASLSTGCNITCRPCGTVYEEWEYGQKPNWDGLEYIDETKTGRVVDLRNLHKVAIDVDGDGEPEIIKRW